MGDHQSWQFALRCGRGLFDPRLRRCPACQSDAWTVVARKALILRLVRCAHCRLLFRIPCDDAAWVAEFYQDDYRSGIMTTQLPTPAELRRLVATSFQGTEKDFSHRVAVLRAVGVSPGARVLDFGASWGYGTWQLRKAGFNAVGYELSRTRAAYGREQLQVPVFDDVRELQGPFDAFFSCHVIEHLQRPSDALALARRLVRPGGRFIAFTPNGSMARRTADPAGYGANWGRLHPVYIDDEFCRQQAGEWATLLASRAYGGWGDLAGITGWDGSADRTSDLSGPELLWVCVVGE